MASDPDDNPFARNSTWPKMPQAPFRVGALPKASPQDREPEPEAPPRTITPLFVRPLAPAQPAQMLSGGATPRPMQRPVPQPEPAPSRVEPPSSPSVIEVELSPVIVQPYRKPRPKPKRSPLPAIAATLVGLAGVLGLALLLSRAQEAALKVPAASPVLAARATTTVVAPAIIEPAGTPPPLVRLTPPLRSATPQSRLQRAAVVRPTSPSAPEVSAATEEMFSAPALSLAPAPPAVVYTPPPAADPAAPVVTRAPYS